MKGPIEKPTVKLLGEDGNAFAIIGKVQEALHKAGADEEYIKLYNREAMSGDYSNLLMVTMDYVNVN